MAFWGILVNNLVLTQRTNYWRPMLNHEEKLFTSFEVGKPFPGPVPHREGAIMELWEFGLAVVIQYPGLRPAELEAFQRGFKTYSYLESSTSVPIAVWVFDFPNPHGQIDSVFNARVVQRDLIQDYLDTTGGSVKNALHFFLLDREILSGMRMVGLHPEAVGLFHDTIKKQLAMEYDRVDYDSCLAGLFTRSTRELFEMGRKFQHG